MQGLREELAVGPRQLSHRARQVLGVGAALLACAFLLTGSHPGGCGSPTWTPGAGSSPAPRWLASDDPLVRGLHLSVLDRARTARDVAPDDVLSADVEQLTRKLGDVGGVAVYLAEGPGFVCLGVDGRQTRYGVADQCLLDVTVVNQGLYVSISPDDTSDGPFDPVRAVGDRASILVVVVPDHATLLTSASTEHLADYQGTAVLRPGRDEVVLQSVDRRAIVINRSLTGTTSEGC